MVPLQFKTKILLECKGFLAEMFFGTQFGPVLFRLSRAMQHTVHSTLHNFGRLASLCSFVSSLFENIFAYLFSKISFCIDQVFSLARIFI